MDGGSTWIVIGRGEAPRSDEDFGAVHVRELTGDRFVLGRSSECDLPLRDMALGRRHLLLLRQGDGWEARDMGSTNGVLLDDERIVRTPLAEGKVLRFGTTTLRSFLGPGAEDRAATAAAALRDALVHAVSVDPAEQAEIALVDRVRAALAEGAERGHPVALLIASLEGDAEWLAGCAAMPFRGLALAIVPLEREVAVLLRAEEAEMQRHVEVFRGVVATMARKERRAVPGFAIRFAVRRGSGSPSVFRNDLARELIAAARSSR